MPLRILSVVRLSQLSDVTTSPERQREHVDRWAKVHQGDVVGQAIDLGVSGAMTPFERPQLSPWLTDSPPEPWDVMVAWRLDRVGRNALDVLTLLQWLEARGKRLVTVADGLDSAGPYAKAFIALAAVFAEMARTASLEMSADARAKLLAEGRWVGGTIGYGYQLGSDNRLEENPEAAKNIRRMFTFADDKIAPTVIAKRLNDDGVTSPRGGKWHRQVVRGILGNPLYIGLGQPPTPALVDPEVFARVQLILDHPPISRARSGPLTNTVFCAECGKAFWLRRDRGYTYMYCRDGHGLKIREDVLLELAVIQFVADHGDEPVYDVVVHPDTTAQDIALCRVELAQIAGQLADPGANRAALRARRSELENRLDDLESLPPQEGRVEHVPTGGTWKDRVDALSLEDFSEELRRRNVKFSVIMRQRKPLEIEIDELHEVDV
jgi:site-specific DNA recombinase